MANHSQNTRLMCRLFLRLVGVDTGNKHSRKLGAVTIYGDTSSFVLNWIRHVGPNFKLGFFDGTPFRLVNDRETTYSRGWTRRYVLVKRGQWEREFWWSWCRSEGKVATFITRSASRIKCIENAMMRRPNAWEQWKGQTIQSPTSRLSKLQCD